VQRAQDQLERRALELRMHIDRDAAAVIADHGGLQLAVEDHVDALGVTVDRLVDRVIDDLPEQVMIAARVDPADVHRRTLAHRLEALEHLDVLGGIGGHDGSSAERLGTSGTSSTTRDSDPRLISE
jgi:hypothetical protein